MAPMYLNHSTVTANIMIINFSNCQVVVRKQEANRIQT